MSDTIIPEPRLPFSLGAIEVMPPVDDRVWGQGTSHLYLCGERIGHRSDANTAVHHIALEGIPERVGFPQSHTDGSINDGVIKAIRQAHAKTLLFQEKMRDLANKLGFELDDPKGAEVTP